MIEALIKRLFHMGFRHLLLEIWRCLSFKKNLTVPAEIHVSGEMSESNHIMIDEMRSLGAKRIIFHRKVTPQEMKICIDYQKCSIQNSHSSMKLLH